MIDKTTTIKTIPGIVRDYRHGKSLREFAGLLSEKMPTTISHQAIKDWQDGSSIPSYYYMVAVAETYTDWRRQMAFEILAILKPELWA